MLDDATEARAVERTTVEPGRPTAEMLAGHVREERAHQIVTVFVAQFEDAERMLLQPRRGRPKDRIRRENEVRG